MAKKNTNKKKQYHTPQYRYLQTDRHEPQQNLEVIIGAKEE